MGPLKMLLQVKVSWAAVHLPALHQTLLTPNSILDVPPPFYSAGDFTLPS